MFKGSVMSYMNKKEFLLKFKGLVTFSILKT